MDKLLGHHFIIIIFSIDLHLQKNYNLQICAEPAFQKFDLHGLNERVTNSKILEKLHATSTW